MTKTDAKVNPQEPACYVVWMLGAKHPVVLYWSGLERFWRRGATRVQVLWWLGPLPP